ncbi:MAG: hypothetical protein AAB373_03175 [Patescibacteria group bacterium]
MLNEIRKMSIEQWFVILLILLAFVLGLVTGYAYFRYWKIETCKPSIEVGDFGE